MIYDIVISDQAEIDLQRTLLTMFRTSIDRGAY